MRRLAIGLVLVVALGLVTLYFSGADRVVLAWALEGQRAAQTAMAGALRSLRAGEPAALSGLLTVCFGYGFFHAVGPGHGKVLIGGYGLAAQVSGAKLATVALVSSLGQAVTAIALVGAGLWLWSWSREQMTDLAEAVFAPLSFAAIALVGLWLVLRGVRGWMALRRADAGHRHTGEGAVCSTCGHAHGPDPSSVAAATRLRDMAAIVGAVAIRPCTGALFVLILTAQLGVFWAGIAGTFAMALGTAAVTVAAALIATTARRGVLANLSGSAALGEIRAAVQIVVGLLVALIAGQLTLAAL